MKFGELKNLFARAAAKYVSPEEAAYFAQEITETDIRKPPHNKFHAGNIDDIRSWEGTDKAITKPIDLPGFTKYDFKGKGPSLKIKEIHDDLERKAKANGISMVSITNSGGMHTMHLWTQGLAKRGLFALSAWNGGPDAVVPFNGTRGIFGTNPMSYAFPGDRGDIVIDMATSEIPFFKILGAKKNQTQLPSGTAVDNDGNITTDPNKAIDDQEVSNLLPMGGNNYKGYNINYLMEIMTSALVGALASSQMHKGYVEKEHGGFIIAIAIDKITDRSTYDATVRSMNEKIRAQKPKKGVRRVDVPGDRNFERMAHISDSTDVSVDAEYIKLLTDLTK